jgi:hypothetical protein
MERAVRYQRLNRAAKGMVQCSPMMSSSTTSSGARWAMINREPKLTRLDQADLRFKDTYANGADLARATLEAVSEFESHIGHRRRG